MVFTGRRLVTVREYNLPHLFSRRKKEMMTAEKPQEGAGRLDAEAQEEALKLCKRSEGTVRFLYRRIDEKQAREEYGLTEEEIETLSQMRDAPQMSRANELSLRTALFNSRLEINQRAAQIAWAVTMMHTTLGPAIQSINEDHENSELHKKECFNSLYKIVAGIMSRPVPDRLPVVEWLEEREKGKK